MAAPVLRVNGRDLSAYMALQHEDGFDPVDAEHQAPQFTGQAALQEGQTFIGNAIGNRSWTIPLVLEAADRPSLDALIAAINNDLVRGAQVEYAHDPTVDASSYFFLEEGRLDPTYEYFLANAATLRCTLHLWTRPFAGTATMRTIASVVAATGPQQLGATGILGDTWALVNSEIRVGSAVASAGRVIGLGVHRSASFAGIRTPSTGGMDAGQASSTIVGASGAVGSQFLAIPISPTGASGISFTSNLTPPEAHVGRHRVFALARSGLNRSIPIYAVDRFGAILGPTALASQTDLTKWQLIDLGEVQVPARASGQEAVPSQQVLLYAGGASGASISASPALQLNRLIYLPLDISPAMLRTPGGNPAQGLSYSDNFDRSILALLNSPNAVPGPGVWTFNIGAGGNAEDFGAPGGNPGGALTLVQPVGGRPALANATGAVLIGSGAMLGDVYASVDVQLTNALGATAASGAVVELWAKTLGGASGTVPSNYVGGRLVLSPSALQSVCVFLASGGAQQVIASAPLVASVASAVMGGLRHTLAVQIIGSTIDVYLATAIGQGQARVTGFAHQGALMPGNPGLYMKTPSYAAAGALYVDNFQARQFGGSAVDINAREWFRFESWPEVRGFQGNASVFVADRSDFRGVPLRLPPTGSPVASGPVQVVAFAGEVDNFVGNDVIDVRLDAMDRFSYLR